MEESRVRRWVPLFKEGRMSVLNEERRGRPSDDSVTVSLMKTCSKSIRWRCSVHFKLAVHAYASRPYPCKCSENHWRDKITETEREMDAALADGSGAILLNCFWAPPRTPRTSPRWLSLIPTSEKPSEWKKIFLRPWPQGWGRFFPQASNYRFFSKGHK